MMSSIIIVYNTHALVRDMRDMEHFTNYHTCSNKIKKQKCTFSKPIEHSYVSKFHDFKHIKEKNPLQFYGCLNMPYSEQLLSKLSKICYTTYQEFNATSTFMLYEKIANDVYRIKTSISCELVDAPIFCIIYQQDDCLDKDTKKMHVLLMYPKYSVSHSGAILKNNNTDIHNSLVSFLNQYITNDTASCNSNGILCTLNKNHKLFSNLMQKTNIIL